MKHYNRFDRNRVAMREAMDPDSASDGPTAITTRLHSLSE